MGPARSPVCCLRSTTPNSSTCLRTRTLSRARLRRQWLYCRLTRARGRRSKKLEENEEKLRLRSKSKTNPMYREKPQQHLHRSRYHSLIDVIAKNSALLIIDWPSSSVLSSSVTANFPTIIIVPPKRNIPEVLVQESV